MRWIILVIASFVAIGCGGSSSNNFIKDGKEISSLTSSQTKEILEQNGIGNDSYTVFGTKRYKISYETIDVNGKKVKASGVVVVPILDNSEISDYIKKVGFATVIDCHGTIFLNENAPSEVLKRAKSIYGAEVAYSSLAGFITLMPDYVGFGDSKEKVHPYLLKKALSQSVVDFTKAAFKFLEDNNIPLSANEELYLSGYSEGGFVALSSVKPLEQAGFNLILSTPMDGPYLLEPIGSMMTNSQTLPAQSIGYVADLIYAYSKAYNFNLDTVFQEPYASTIPSLFDKKHSSYEIYKNLTTKTKGEGGLFTDNFIDEYNISNFRLELFKNSITNPQARTQIDLIHCMGDDVVPYKVAQEEKKLLGFLGNHIKLFTVDSKENPLTHAKCFVPAYAKALHLFMDSRENILGY